MPTHLPLCFFGWLIVSVTAMAEQPAVALIPGDAKPIRIDADFELADGPSWNGNVVVLSDVKRGTVHHWNPIKSQLGDFNRAKGKFSGTFYQRDSLYLSNNPECRIEVVPNKGKPFTLHQFPEAHRPNDLVVDRDGNVMVTLTKQGQVALVTPNGDGAQTTTLAEGLVTPNGIGLSPDGLTLYVSEMKPRIVTAFTLLHTGESITATDRRLFATMNQDPTIMGGGDGMTVDRAGNVFCAGADGVYVWKPDGTLWEKIEFPSRPINCIIGGRKQPTLYTTCFDGVYELPVNSYAQTPRKIDADGNDAKAPIGTTSLKSFDDVVFGSTESGRKLFADIHRPASDKVLPAVVYVHGGGWLHGDKSSTRRMARRLARLGYVTMSAEYRLGYEAAFPAGVQDVHAAIAFLREHAEEYGVDAQRIAAVGGSAGGHIVGLVGSSTDVPELLPESVQDEEASKLQAVIVMAGPMETLTGSVAEKSSAAVPVSNAENWMKGTIDEKRHLYELADVLTKIDAQSPPMLFQCGSLDSPERNQATRDKLSGLDIANELKVYESGTHGVWNQEKWVDRYVNDQDAFLRRVGF